MKVMVIGCGSIGRRHLRNLQHLGIRDLVACDVDPARLEYVRDELGVTALYTDYRAALAPEGGVRAAVVATPSSMHLEMGTYLAQRGVDVFMEKPLGHRWEGTEPLRQAVEAGDVVFMMGMCYRFHRGLRLAREILLSGELGRILHVNYFGGSYLPDWHPGCDYRQEYAAREDMGGGVVLTSIHGLDNVRWLFGEVKRVAAVCARVGDLEVSAEDYAAALLELSNGRFVQYTSDFVQRAPTHRVTAVGTEGTLEADFIGHRLRVYAARAGDWREIHYDFEVNEMYVEEMKVFLDCVSRRLPPPVGLDEGLRTLRLALAVKEAALLGAWVPV